jgi:chromosome segregation ATPase
MRLESLKVFGFKTFAEATTLDFADGPIAVVGPNGSGKSNLVDAIRWVLGEQSTRSLRSQRMEDVIFAGNNVRQPRAPAAAGLQRSPDHPPRLPGRRVGVLHQPRAGPAA